MENNLIESLLYDSPKPLGLLLSERFNEHVHFTHLSPTYVVHFLMGLSSMLMSDHIRTKYGIEGVFFTHFGPEKIVRLTILTAPVHNTPGRKTIKVRTFDMSGKRIGQKILLSTGEKKVMKLLLNGETSDLPADFTKAVEDFYKNEQNFGKIDLDQYIAEYALYAVDKKEIHKVDKLDTQTRIKLNFFESSMYQKLKEQFDKNHMDISRFFVPSSEFEFLHEENKIVLLTDRKVIKPRTQTYFDPDAMHNLYSRYYDANGVQSLEKFKEVFTDRNGLADVFKSMSFSTGISAECGFTHGTLFLLSYSYSSHIEVRQKIGTALYTPGEDGNVDPSTKMSLVYKPEFRNSEHTLDRIPMVVLFARHYTAPREAVDEISTSMSITGEVGGLAVKLGSKKVESGLRILQKRADLVNDLLHLSGKHSDQPEVFANQVELKLKKARPLLREFKFSESNHLSGYLAGWIMSSENKDSESYSLLGRTDTRSTKFFIRSTKREDTSNEVQLMPTNVLLIIKEEKMSNMHFPDTYALDEEYVRYNRLNAEDTVVINIGQEYVHSTRDFLTTDNEQDFARYTVSISFAKSDDIVESHAFFALPKVPLSTFHSLTDDLTDVMKQELTQLFRSGSFFANTGSDLVAFLDGIFLDNQCLKSTKKLESTHSDVYYIRKLGGPRMLKMNFKIMSDRMTEQEFIEIAKSANEELQTSMWKDESQFFQFVLSEKDGILDVQFLDTGRLSTCAGVRLRRGSLHQCLIDLDAGAIKNSEKNQDPDQSRTVDEINVVKAYKSLVKVLKISRYMMLGFMVRDAISDAVNKHYGAAAMDIGFLLASVYSPTLGEMAKTTANALLETGSKFSGYALKTLSFGIERAISIYVFTDLIENAIAYGKDSKNTNAGIGLAIDAAFLTIDLVTAAAEAFGAFTFMTPVGQIASVLLIVGMNVYQTVKTVEQIEQILPLNTGEVIDESLRAFFHVNPEDYIRKLMSEKLANSELMQQALDYLKKQSNIDTYITGSAEFSGNVLVMHGDTIIDMRSSFYQRISRASPGIDASEKLKNANMACFLREEKIEIEHEKNYWEKFAGFFWKIYKTVRILDRLIRNDYTGSIKVASECDDNCIQKHTPTCTNAFGISKKLTSNDKAALFKLGNGSDLVYGYDEKPNIFLMAGGVKNVTGGSMNDTFVVGIGPITATIEGLDGMDMLDLSSFSPDKLNIDGNILEYELGSIRSHLMIKNIETIILPIGGKVKNSVNVSVEDNIQHIVSFGKTNIVIQSRSIDQGLILELSENTNVTNYAKEGAISYLIRANDNMGLQYTSLSILGESGAKQEIFFLQNLWDLENMTYNQDGTLSFLTINGQGIRLYASRNILEKTRIIFNDGSMISLNNSILLSATLSTDRTIQQIEHMYVNVLERLGILMVAYSSSDDESVTISHGKILESRSSVMSQILHNSVDHSTHMVLNGGQYLILINTNPQGKLEDTSIKSRNANNLTEVIIDLSDVIEFHMRDDSSFIELEAYLLNQSDLHVEVKFKKSDSLVLLGNIVIRDILRDDLYSKIRIRNYGELNINLHDRARNYYRVENATDQYVITTFDGEAHILSPSPIKFANSTDVIVLTPYNVEPFNEITIDSDANQFDNYSINATTLVLTNLRYNYLNNSGKILTMFFEGFYMVDKMETLQLRLGAQVIQLKEFKRSMAADFSDWWMSTQKMINLG